jgi:hypothetical protein
VDLTSGWGGHQANIEAATGAMSQQESVSKRYGVTGDLEFARLRNSREIEGSSLCCSALDSQATLGIEELMLAHPGYTILVVTHKMAQARRVSQECAFMLLGKVIEHDHTENLFRTPRDSRTAEYVEGRYG